MGYQKEFAMPLKKDFVACATLGLFISVKLTGDFMLLF